MKHFWDRGYFSQRSIQVAVNYLRLIKHHVMWFVVDPVKLYFQGPASCTLQQFKLKCQDCWGLTSWSGTSEWIIPIQSFPSLSSLSPRHPSLEECKQELMVCWDERERVPHWNSKGTLWSFNRPDFESLWKETGIHPLKYIQTDEPKQWLAKNVFCHRRNYLENLFTIIKPIRV